MFRNYWEYKWEVYETFNKFEDKTYFETFLNDRGKDGWELVSVIINHTNDRFRECYFKRPL